MPTDRADDVESVLDDSGLAVFVRGARVVGQVVQVPGLSANDHQRVLSGQWELGLANSACGLGDVIPVEWMGVIVEMSDFQLL